MKTVTLNKSDLLAISRFAAIKDIRYYLNGVLLSIGPGESRLCATNGHILGLLRLKDTFIEDLTEPANYIIPSEVLADFKPKAKDYVNVVNLTIGDDEKSGTLADPVSGVSRTFKFVEGKFPQYQHVIQSGELSGIACRQFNFDLLVAFNKAAKDLGGTHFMMNHNGPEKAVLVTIPTNPNFVGVLMPYFEKGVEAATSPDWSRDRELHKPVIEPVEST